MTEQSRIIAGTSEAERRHFMQLVTMDRAIKNGSWFAELSGLRGEQPNNPALPVDGALRGDVPLSEAERSEV